MSSLINTIALSASVLVLVACDRPAQVRMEVTESRPAFAREPKPVLGMGADRRFAMGRQPSPTPGPVVDSSAASTPKTPGEAPVMEHITPEGWTKVEPTAMRNPNMRFGENEEGECYISRMAGGGGGVLDNVNRWRTQMGLDSVSEEDLQANLEKGDGEVALKSALGIPGIFLDLKGDFKAMGAPEPKGDYQLLGLILPVGGYTMFIKMTGPQSLVTAQAENFDAFCKSLKLVPKS